MVSNKSIPNDELLELLKEACTTIVVDPTTKAVSIQGSNNMQQLDSIVEIILNNTEWSKKFDDIGYSKEVLRHKLKYDVVAKLKNRTNFTIRDFNQILKRMIQQKPNMKTYYFVFPINFQFPLLRNQPIKKEYIINSTKLKILDYYEFISSKFYNDVVKKDLDDNYPNTNLLNQSFQYILISFKGRDVQYSADEAFDKLSIFLSILNLSLYYQRIKDPSFGDKRMAISSIKGPPNFFSYNNRKKYSTMFYTNLGNYSKSEKINSDKYYKFIGFYDAISKITSRNDFYEMIYRILQIYQAGITETDKASAFIKFWTALEIMTLKKRNMTHTYMNQRIKSIFKKSKIFDRRLADALNKRNDLIHEQIQNINQYDLNSIKSICEIMLIFIVSHCNIFNNFNKIGIFYDHGHKEKETLKTEKKIIEEIIKSRRKTR